MTNLTKLPTWADKTHIYAVVETPRGNQCKLEYDPKLRVFTLSKPLMAGLTDPYDWGFIPSSRAEDGDTLDVLVIHDAGTYPGLLLRCKPIGALEVLQTSKGRDERNDRIFAVPDRFPFEATCKMSGGFRNGLSRSLRNFLWRLSHRRSRDLSHRRRSAHRIAHLR
jgi:inorganic pyrophosphatase